MSGNYRHEKNCLNCGHQVEKHYCSQCGQPNLELKEPFWHFIGHSVGHYFHFDSKFFQTLVPLLTKPGQITLDYLAGKRARYIHPVSLYIFVSIVYFLIVPHVIEENERPEKDAPAKVATVAKPTKENDSAKKVVNANKEKLDAIIPGLSDKITTVLTKNDVISEGEFANLDFTSQKAYLESMKKLNEKEKSTILANQITEYEEINTQKNDSTYTNYINRQKTLPADQRDSWYLQKLKRIDYGFSGKTKNHQYVNEEFKKYQPKQYFLLMPLLAFFIMINFRKNKIYYINHLVFTVHGMTAFFIVSIIAEPIKKYIFGLGSFMSGLIATAVFCGIVWYLYRGLKLFYNRSRAMTIRKTIMLMLLYSIALVISEAIIKGIIIYILP